VLLGEASEGTGADLFLSVFEEHGGVDDGEVSALVGEGNVLGISESNLLGLSDVLGDGHGHEVDLVANGKSLLVHALEEFHLVHESFEGVSPSLSDSLHELSLHLVDLEFGVSLSSFNRELVGENESRNNGALSTVVADDLSLEQIILEDSGALSKVEGSSVNVETFLRRLIVWAVNSSEVGNLSSTGLLPESLRVTLFTFGRTGTAEDFLKFAISSLVSLGDLLSGVGFG